MFALRTFLAVGLVFGLADLSLAAKGAKKKNTGIQGQVTAVTPDKDNSNAGTITVKTVAAKKKKNAAADSTATAPNGEEKKISVTKDTKFEKIDAPAKGEKKAKGAALTGKEAKFSDVTTGATIQVSLKSGSSTEAEKVVIMPAKKAKNKKANNNNE
jgi:hypothetical protein